MKASRFMRGGMCCWIALAMAVISAVFSRFCRARRGLFFRQEHPFFTDDDAVQVSPMVDLNYLARMDVFGNKHAIENFDGGVHNGPGRAVEKR